MSEVLSVELAGTTCEALDPLKVEGIWKNNKLEHGTHVGILVLFAYYDEHEGAWYYWGFTHEDKTWVWGIKCSEVAPYKGETDDFLGYTYTPWTETEVNVGVEVWIYSWETIKDINELQVDLGKGYRVMGLQWDQVVLILEGETPWGAKFFPNKLIVKPYTPPAEILDVNIEIG